MEYKTLTINDYQLRRTEKLSPGEAQLMGVTELLNREASSGWELVTALAMSEGDHALILRKG